MGVKTIRHIFLCLAFLSAGVFPAAAQVKISCLNRVASPFHAITGASGYDTTFIAKPSFKWKVTLRTSAKGFDVSNANTLEGVGYEAFRSSRTRLTEGVDVSFCGVKIGLGFDPQKVFAKKKFRDKSYSLIYYGNRFGIDAMLHFTPSLDGELKKDGSWISLPEGTISHRNLYISGYYVFNCRQFSYPAAFSQSFIQKRSAGSALAATMYSRSRFSIHPWEVLDNHETVSTLRTLCLGAGYGYNFVLAKGWLLHLSAIPALSLFSKTDSVVDGVPASGRAYSNIMLNQRFALVKYFAKDRLFVNLTAYGIGLLALKEDRFSYAQAVWDTRLLVGVRF